MQWLKEHIRDEGTTEEWVQQFVKAVTGSPGMNASDKIKVYPVVFERNRYYTSHTCFNQLDINSNSNECPGFFDPDPKRIFIQNLTDGLLASKDSMLLA